MEAYGLKSLRASHSDNARLLTEHAGRITLLEDQLASHGESVRTITNAYADIPRTVSRQGEKLSELDLLKARIEALERTVHELVNS